MIKSFTIFSLIILFQNCFAQFDNNSIANSTIEKDGVKFLFRIDKTTVTAKDTLNIQLEILNESDTSIYVIPTINFTYVMDTVTNIPNSIYLDFGGGIDENKISRVPFLEIKTMQNLVLNKIFFCNNFEHAGFDNEIYFLLWYGYLKPWKYVEFKPASSSDEYLYFDQFNSKFFEKDLTSLLKIKFQN